MYKIIFLFVLCMQTMWLASQEFSIQENEKGFCSVDGIIDTGVAGYTGIGFANTDIGANMSITWSIYAEIENDYQITWHYGNGGGSGALLGKLTINNQTQEDTVIFYHTDKWYNWTNTDTLSIHLLAGKNQIRLTSISANGLANIDYVSFFGSNLSPDTCIGSYKLQISQNIAEGGEVTYSPVQDYYDAGTLINAQAVPASGYFFQSWSGTQPDTNEVLNFGIEQNSELKAMFYPVGTSANPEIAGYVSVQDDKGTPYLLTGGLGGDTVLAENEVDLEYYLSQNIPMVILVNTFISGISEIDISSNKSLVGVGPDAHLEGIRIKIGNAENIIIRNLIFSKVIQFDEIEINGSHHIWIDHCEFYTDRDHDIDYYDGLLDIKNEASFITVSWCKFHDHHKAILISSGDGNIADTSIRVTFHHNYFYNCGARLPSLRFGKAHVFSNYYVNNESAINSRMGACIKVENNFFSNTHKAIRVDQSLETGNIDLGLNLFDNSLYVAEPVCSISIPYPYSSLLDDIEDLPKLLVGDTNINTDLYKTAQNTFEIIYFPNPALQETNVEIRLDQPTSGRFLVYSLQGQLMYRSSEYYLFAGINRNSIKLDKLNEGLYHIVFQGQKQLLTALLEVQ